MKQLFVFLLFLAVLSTGCATHKATTPHPKLPPLPATSGSPAEQQARDTSSTTPAVAAHLPQLTPEAKAGVLQRVLNVFRPTPTGVVVNKGTKTKCRGCITNNNYVLGDQHNNTSTTGKKAVAQQTSGGTSTQETASKTKGPTAQGQSTAKDQSHSGISSDVTGDGNKQEFTNTAPPEKSLWALAVDNITSPIGAAIGFIIIGGVVFLVIKRKFYSKIA